MTIWIGKGSQRRIIQGQAELIKSIVSPHTLRKTTDIEDKVY